MMNARTFQIATSLVFTLFLIQCNQLPASSASKPLTLEVQKTFKCGSNLFKTKEDFVRQSNQNINSLRRRVGDLSAREKSLVDLAKKFPPALIHRTSSQNYEKIRNSGMIQAPDYSQDSNDQVSHGRYYSRIEETLFNSGSCVFASLGPCDGREIYGDIKICLQEASHIANNSDRLIWASAVTGYQLGRREGKKGAELEDAFKKTIVVSEDFESWLQLFMIERLRTLPSRDSLVALLEKAKTNREWWSIVDSNKLGYLEVKFDQYVPLSFAKPENPCGYPRSRL